MKTLAILASLVAAAIVGGLAVLYSGVYDVSATDQHLRPTFWVLQTGLRESVERRGAAIEAPALDDPALARRGLAHFRAHCVQCHGAPGVAPEPFALGLTPLPGSLSHTAREWTPAELFWVIRNGIKMTGMPAWQFRMSEDELWSIVAFLKTLPGLSPDGYRSLQALEGAPRSPDDVDGQRRLERGRRALRQFGCVGCHTVPGVVAAESYVGPPLDRIGTRRFIAGQLPNTPENMILWIRQPQSVSPGSAMPDLGVGEREARDIAEYLYSLR